MIRRIISTITRSVIFLLAASPPALWANESTNNAASSQPLKLVTMAFPPYSFKTKDEVRGITVDIISEVFKRINRPIEINLIPWSRALRNIKLGASDGLFQALHKPERESFMDYCQEPLMQEQIKLYSLKESTFQFNGDLNSLKGRSIGARQDFSYGDAFDKAKKEGWFNITEKVDVRSLLLLLNHKKIEFVIGDRYGVSMTAFRERKRLPDLAIKPFSKPISEVTSYFAFSKVNKLQYLCKPFNQALTKLKKMGTYQKLIDNWVEN